MGWRRPAGELIIDNFGGRGGWAVSTEGFVREGVSWWGCAQPCSSGVRRLGRWIQVGHTWRGMLSLRDLADTLDGAATVEKRESNGTGFPC